MKTPDLDALVLDALRASDLGATILVNMPETPAESLPLIVAHQIPGGTANSMGLVVGLVDLQVMAATRRDASDLARSAYSALADACLAQFEGSDGHLCRMEQVTGAPVEIRTGDPAPDTVLFRFHTTCRVVARASL